MSNTVFRSSGDKKKMNKIISLRNQIATTWKEQLHNHFGFHKVTTKLHNVRFFFFINSALKEEIISGKQFAEFISRKSTLNVIAIPYKSNSAVSIIKVHYIYNTNFYKYSPSSNCSLWVVRIILYFTILYYIYNRNIFD